MAYQGLVIPIPLGQAGLLTDDSPSSIPPTSLITANNITFQNNLAEKMGGSIKFNQSAIPGGVMGMCDFWVTEDEADRRLIVVGGDGKTYNVDNAGVVTEITALSPAPAVLTVNNQVFLLPCGNETASSERKLMIFTGNDVVQVIFGTNMQRQNIASPAADWSGSNQPSFGIVYRNSVYAGGNRNAPHFLYTSDPTNHEDFSGSGSYVVYPGDSEGLIGAHLYKGRLFAYKYPRNAYLFVDTDADSTNWYFQKSDIAFGFGSAHSAVSVLSDVLVKNASDSINSVVAVQEFGDTKAGDVLAISKIESFIRDNTDPDGTRETHGIYYPEKKLVMFTYRSTTSETNDRILMFRVDTSTGPRASFITKDRPNCLALRKDSRFIERPIYGSLDGFVYLMDQESRDVAGISYIGEFQIPHTDFGIVDSKLAGVNKHFDFLELRYVPQGDWNVYADIFIDGNLYETVTFPMTGNDLLAGDDILPNDFMLSESATDPEGSFLAGEDLLSIRKRLHGTGRTISVRVYNSGLDETFKLATMIISFRASGEQQR